MTVKMTIRSVQNGFGEVVFYDVQGLGVVDDSGDYRLLDEYPKSVIVCEEGCVYRNSLVEDLDNFDDLLLTDLARGMHTDFIWVPFTDSLSYNLIKGTISAMSDCYPDRSLRANFWDTLSRQLMQNLEKFYEINVDTLLE